MLKLGAFYQNLLKILPIYVNWLPSPVMKTPQSLCQNLRKTWVTQKAGTYTYTMSMWVPPWHSLWYFVIFATICLQKVGVFIREHLRYVWLCNHYLANRKDNLTIWSVRWHVQHWTRTIGTLFQKGCLPLTFIYRTCNLLICSHREFTYPAIITRQLNWVCVAIALNESCKDLLQFFVYQWDLLGFLVALFDWKSHQNLTHGFRDMVK